MNNDKDAQFLCKDCARFNLCKYYDRRKEDSYICKYFHLTETYLMTNGDVMKVLFPNATFTKCTDCVAVKGMDSYTHCFDIEWWNAPYKKGGE